MVSSIDSGNNSGLNAVGRTTLRQPDNLSWYALQIQSKLGSVASATLCGKGCEAYLPLYRCGHRWSDRVKQLDLPLFPGYLFCRFDVRDRLPILTTPGVISVVGAGKTPVPVDDAPGVISVVGAGKTPVPVDDAPGVISVVGAGKTPVPVDDEEIEAIRAILRS